MIRVRFLCLIVYQNQSRRCMRKAVALFNPFLGIRRFNSFAKSISLKVNVIARLEIEFAYFDVTLLHNNH